MRRIALLFIIVAGAVLQMRGGEPGSAGSWFGRISAGAGDFTSRTYRGPEFGMEVGYFPVRGLSVGVGIGWYTSHADRYAKVSLDGVFIPDTWDYYMEPTTRILTKDSEKLQNSLRLRGFVGYDMFSLIRGCGRFHLTPVLGFGVSQQRLFYYRYISEKIVIGPLDGKEYSLLGVVESEHRVRSRFEMDLGARFDVDLPKGWAVGAYYTWYFLNQKMSGAGLALTKTF